MADSQSTSDGRHQVAADRDDAAHTRDDISIDRDVAAEQRDSAAAARELLSGELAADFAEWLGYQSQDLLARIARHNNDAIDPDDYPDVGPAALARLRAHADDQRRLAAIDRTAAVALVAELRNQLRHMRGDQRCATREREAAARDRTAAADDRRAAADDRDHALQDRSQTAIEREQASPADPAWAADRPRPETGDRMSHTAAMIARAERAVDDSRRLRAERRSTRS